MSEPDGGNLILEGVKILDLTQYLAGSGVTRMMAELGADIIKVELPDTGDGARFLPVVADNGRSAWFVQHNRGKKSLCVDWNTAEGLQIIKDLVPLVDVVTENTGTPEILAKRGLDYASFAVAQPQPDHGLGVGLRPRQPVSRQDRLRLHRAGLLGPHAHDRRPRWSAPLRRFRHR